MNSGDASGPLSLASTACCASFSQKRLASESVDTVAAHACGMDANLVCFCACLAMQ